MPAPDESPSPTDQAPSPAQATDSPAQATDSPAQEAPAPSEQAGPLTDKPVDDANDLRTYYFKQLVRKRVTWILTLVAMVAAGVGLAIAVGAAVGGGAALAVLILSLIIVFVIADSKSADSFFELYAAQRGLTLAGRGYLPEVTPLLSRGDERYAERTFSGPIAEEVEGTLALYTYVTETTDSEGNRDKDYHRFTVGLVEIPDCAEHVPELFCQQKFGFHSLEKFEDVFRRSKERVKLESAALDDKYEIFSAKGQDANWLRQLFSPTFIVWMTDQAPKRFAFELVNGSLCCYIHGHENDAEGLDMVSTATGHVARRLTEESNE
jgi:hypothetical protein